MIFAVINFLAHMHPLPKKAQKSIARIFTYHEMHGTQLFHSKLLTFARPALKFLPNNIDRLINKFFKYINCLDNKIP